MNMFDGQPYVAAFPRNDADGTIHRKRFRTTWTESLDIRIEAVRQFGMEPIELSDARTGNIIWRYYKR